VERPPRLCRALRQGLDLIPSLECSASLKTGADWGDAQCSLSLVALFPNSPGVIRAILFILMYMPYKYASCCANVHRLM
jgi:hypothetical protein